MSYYYSITLVKVTKQSWGTDIALSPAVFFHLQENMTYKRGPGIQSHMNYELQRWHEVMKIGQWITIVWNPLATFSLSKVALRGMLHLFESFASYLLHALLESMAHNTMYSTCIKHLGEILKILMLIDSLPVFLSVQSINVISTMYIHALIVMKFIHAWVWQ